jgi:hypothetical protein
MSTGTIPHTGIPADMHSEKRKKGNGRKNENVGTSAGETAEKRHPRR